MTDFKDFKAKLKAYRADFGTQRAFAEFLGISFDTYKFNENGNNKPPRRFIQLLIEKTGFPLHHWLTQKEQALLYIETVPVYVLKELAEVLKPLDFNQQKALANYINQKDDI